MGVEQGLERVVTKASLAGMDVELIAQITGLSVEQIKVIMLRNQMEEK